VSIILNQVAVWIDSPVEWDIYDLRNVVLTILQNELSAIGYLKGLAYDVEIRRVLNPLLGVDCVFGIEMPCIAERNKAIVLDNAISTIRKKLTEPLGVYLHLCLTDLKSAMKEPNDTSFFCYRAIESLRQHCVAKFSLNPKNKDAHWEKFREIAKCDRTAIMMIKASADAPRHGDVAAMTADERVKLLTTTWDIVDAYLATA